MLVAKAHGEKPPTFKERKKNRLSGISFKQEDVAQRKGITAPLGTAAIGADENTLNQKHSIPQEHVKAHYAMYDAKKASGLAMAQVEPTLKRQILREKEKQRVRESREKKEREKQDKRTPLDLTLQDVTKKLNFDDIPDENSETTKSPSRSKKRTSSVSRDIESGDIVHDVRVSPTPKKRPKLLNPPDPK